MSNSNYLIVTLTILGAILSTMSHRILVLHPVYAGSHIFALRRILEQLLREGHQIKVVRWKESSDYLPLNSANISETILAVSNSDGTVPFMSKEERARFEFPSRLLWERGLTATAVFDGGMLAVAASCEALFKEENLIQELCDANFQLAIVDLIYNECGLALAHHLNLPVVAYWGLSFVSGETQYTTAFNPPSAIPHLYTPFTDRMNFLQRFVNVWYGIGSHLVMQLQFYHTNYYIKKYLPNTPHPSILLSNISGLLINSHWVFDYPKQLPPSFFQIGGFHIRDPKPLPKDLKEFVEDSEEGVILFSLGKNFDSHSLPQSVFQAYLQAFARLKEKIIVRSSIVPKNLPKNIRVLDTIPQADILAHPKTILFITHCGLHGVMEAIHFGVKMIAVPIFFDQGNVADRLVDQGIALALSKTVSESDVFEAIDTVIKDKSFDRNMKRISNMYHTSFEKPLDRALWLIDHVISTNGADHLKMKVKDLTYIQYFCIDVLCVMALISFGLLYFVRQTCLWVGKKFCKEKKCEKRKLE